MPKRYILLKGSHYYPSKWDDYVGTFDSVEEAKEFVESFSYPIDDWVQIVDGFTMRLVCECPDFYLSPDIWETRDD